MTLHSTQTQKEAAQQRALKLYQSVNHEAIQHYTSISDNQYTPYKPERGTLYEAAVAIFNIDDFSSPALYQTLYLSSVYDEAQDGFKAAEDYVAALNTLHPEFIAKNQFLGLRLIRVDLTNDTPDFDVLAESYGDYDHHATT